MPDKLHQLESLVFLDNTEEWVRLRGIRNSFANDYPQDDQLKAAYLLQAINASIA